MYADEDVAACRFAYYHIHTRGSLPVGLAIDASQSLWFTGVDKISPARVHRSRSDGSVAPWLHPPLLTLSTLRVNAKQGRRKRSKVADGQCVKRCHLVTDTLARLLPITVPANLPWNDYR